MAKSKLVELNGKIAETVVGGYRKIEETVVGGYRNIEDSFVDRYLTHDGESVAEAKARIHAEQAERQEEAVQKKLEREAAAAARRGQNRQ